MSQQKFSRYHIIDEIGRGGMAVVYRAFDPMFKRDVAMKVMSGEHLGDETLRIRFEREAQTIATLEHPAIVPVYDFGEQEGLLFLVMRLMTGGTLTDRLRKGSLSISETTKILQRIGGALERAHDNGIIHRDLKPSNILFDSYGDAFLADFGIARLAESTMTLTGQSVVGTPAYMSPEQIHGDKQIDGRSDIYALGVICFEMLTGQRPFQDVTPAKVMMKHIIDPVPDIRQVKPDLPDGVDMVIAKTMAKKPEERYAKASEMTDTLEAIARPTALGTVPQAPPAEEEEPDQKAAVVASAMAAAAIADDVIDDKTVSAEEEELSVQAPVTAPSPVEPSREPMVAADLTEGLDEDVMETEVAQPGFPDKPVDEVVPETEVARPVFPAKPPDEAVLETEVARPVFPAKPVDEAVPETDVARPVFPTAPKEEKKRLPLAPILIGAMAFVAILAIVGIVLAVSGVFAPDEETPDDERPAEVAAGATDEVVEATRRRVTATPREEQQEPSDASIDEVTSSESRQIMAEANALFEAGDIDSAIHRASEAIELAPELAENYYLRSLMYFNIEDYESAIRDIDRAVEIDPQAEYFYQRGLTERRLDNYDLAIDNFHQAIDLNPDNPEPLIDLSVTFRVVGDLEESVEAADRAIEMAPDNDRAHSARGRSLKEMGDFEAALSELHIAVELNPENWRAVEDLAEIYAWHLDDPHAGLEWYNRSVDLFPNDGWRISDRGVLHGRLGELDAAMADFERAAELDPENPWIWVQRGITLRDAFDDIPAALESFERAKEINPEAYEPFEQASETYRYYLDDLNSALAEIDRAIERAPWYRWLYTVRAEIFRDMGDLDAAEAAFIEATTIEEGDAWAFIDLGHFYWDVLTEPEAAFDAWNTAVEIDPENPHAHHGRYFYNWHNLGDSDAALADLGRCIELEPEFPWCYWDRAWIYVEIDDQDAAVSNFELYLEYAFEDDCPECNQEAMDYLASH